MEKVKARNPKIGLALGGGGARGLSFIGVIKVFEENKIPVDYIAGTSIGALIGGFYASGMPIEEIEKIATGANRRLLLSLLDPHLKTGLIGGDKVKKFIENFLHNKKIEDCRLPFAAVATNLKTGEAVVFRRGELASAIRASISIPLIFKPVEINNLILADGGLSAPVPVEAVRNMGADKVIAVNLDKYYFKKRQNLDFISVADNSLSILRHNLAGWHVKKADAVINPYVQDTRWHKFNNAEKLILAGEDAARQALPKLKELIKN